MGFDLRKKIKFKEMENNDLIFSVVMRKNRRDALNIIKYCIYNYIFVPTFKYFETFKFLCKYKLNIIIYIFTLAYLT